MPMGSWPAFFLKAMHMRTAKYLKISDLHMSNRLPNAVMVAEGATDRLQDQLALWERVHATAIHEEVDKIIILGDLFDKSMVDAVTLTATVEAIVSAPVPVDILPGNHDAISTRGGRYNVEAFGKLGHDRVRYIGGGTGERCPSIEVDGWLRMWPIEYCPSETALEHLAAIRAQVEADRRTLEVLLLHHSIVGCSHLGWVCDDGLVADEVTAGFDRVYSGHFHEAQRFGSKGTGLYLGAPMHHRMDDEGREAGFWVVEYNDDGTVEESFYDGGAPRFHSTKWAGSSAKTKHKASPGDYLRVYVEATHAEWLVLRPSVERYVEVLKSQGIHAEHKLKPTYHHDVRIAPSTIGERARMEDMVPAYVDAPEVDTTGLDPVKLKAIGRQAIDEARRRV